VDFNDYLYVYLLSVLISIFTRRHCNSGLLLQRLLTRVLCVAGAYYRRDCVLLFWWMYTLMFRHDVMRYTTITCMLKLVPLSRTTAVNT